MNILLLTGRANSDADTGKLASHMPYGIGYIAATLKRYTTHNVWIIDVPHKDAAYGDIAGFIEEHAVTVIGISAVVANYLFCVDFTRFIRKQFPHVTIIMGGAMPTAMPRIMLEDCCVDIIVRGPGEMAFMDIVNNVSQYAGNQQIVNGWFPDVLEQIPWPDWKGMDYASYPNLPPWSAFPIMSNRGCPYQCNYCYKINGDLFKVRAIDDVFNEICFISDQFGINHFMMQDELFFVTPSRVRALCQKIIAHGLRVSWSAVSRIDVLDEATIALLSEAGCTAIAVGIESGSEKMLALMNKKLSLEKSRQNIALLQRYGIKIMPYIIVGYPGETKDTLAETEAFLIENRLYSTPTYAFPFPGTKLWDIALSTAILGDVRKYLRRPTFSVSEMRYNYTQMGDDELQTRVEHMKQRVLFSYIDSFCNEILAAGSQNCDIWIYGAGYLGRGVYDYLKNQAGGAFSIKGFIDDDPLRQGEIGPGVPVLPLDKTGIEVKDICIVANSYFPEVMLQKLKAHNTDVQSIVLA